ncbi:hypothetical protein GCM10017562_35560 [Streptomyces roseofulvus]
MPGRSATLGGAHASVRSRSWSPYPYREIEHASTRGGPPSDSLTAGFLAFPARGRGRHVVRARGHLPCATPEGPRICGEG